MLLHPPVWVSHTTSHLVEAEEAPFVVARDPVMLPNMQWTVTHFAIRFRIFPVTADSGIVVLSVNLLLCMAKI